MCLECVVYDKWFAGRQRPLVGPMRTKQHKPFGCDIWTYNAHSWCQNIFGTRCCISWCPLKSPFEWFRRWGAHILILIADTIYVMLSILLHRLHFQQCSCNAQIFLEHKYVPKLKEFMRWKEQPSHVRIEGTSGESAHYNYDQVYGYNISD